MQFNPRTLLAAAAVSLGTLSAAGAQAGFINGFEGTSVLDNVLLGSAYRPPDTMGAVGTTQFLESNNGSYAVYNKYTGAVQQRISMDTFWGNAGQAPAAGGDQRVLFDQYTNRWITIGFGATNNVINIAVSDTDNAMGTWKSTVLAAQPAGFTADYPTLGMDDKGVYIGTNNFNAGNNFAGTSLFVIPKADLFGGAPSTVNVTELNSPYPPGADRGFAIQGAVNWGGNPGNTASVMAVDLFAYDQRFYQVSGVNGPGATQGASTLIGGVGYQGVNPARQPDGSRVVDALDDRIAANVYQANGKLYSVHTVTPLGTDYSVVRWSVVDANTGALIEEGDIGMAGCDFYQGSIAANEFGEAVIGYNRSCGAGVLPGDAGRIAFTGQQLVTDGFGGLDMFGAEMLFRLSEVDDYHCGARNAPPGSCRERWGDYSAVSIDPLDHHSFFAIGEYAAEWANLSPLVNLDRAIWHTYIAQVAFDDVPEPGTCALLGLGLFSLFGSRRRRAAA